MSMRIPLTHSNEVTRFSPACSNCLPHSSLSPPSARTESNSAPTTRRLCFKCVLCPLKAFVVSAFPYRPPEKQDAPHEARVSAFSAGLRFSSDESDEAKKCTGGLCSLLHSHFLFGEVLIRAALKWFRSGLLQDSHHSGLDTTLHLFCGKYR